MMWQDFVFMIGSSLSIGFLAPTLRDASARVPLGTSVPSMTIGIVYGITFATLGMTFSSLGAFVTGVMWSLVAVARSPVPETPEPTRREHLRIVGGDLATRLTTRLETLPVVGPYVAVLVSTDAGHAVDHHAPDDESVQPAD
ncbi:hypothetical protein [Halovivax limisalsi]|uniref:hypothetical protein n=1 Tax=Halovivax limisalsi TaxID=1453760 RepID=UPI001FFC5C37|nr:hypothetical protein [Halovivax limisalsi]